MKKNKMIKTIIDLYGYSTGIATAWCMFIVLNDIMTYGISRAWHSTGDFILWVEIISVFSFIPFCIYKFFISVINRDKIEKYEVL